MKDNPLVWQPTASHGPAMFPVYYPTSATSAEQISLTQKDMSPQQLLTSLEKTQWPWGVHCPTTLSNYTP